MLGVDIALRAVACLGVLLLAAGLILFAAAPEHALAADLAYATGGLLLSAGLGGWWRRHGWPDWP